jgi:hypothetical protein
VRVCVCGTFIKALLSMHCGDLAGLEKTWCACVNFSLNYDTISTGIPIITLSELVGFLHVCL